jgi:predicted ATPase
LPLAIELAASNIQQFSRLPTSLTCDDILTFKHQAASERVPDRQRDLTVSLDWSFGFLSDNEATIFCVSSVFTGMFELDDVVAIASAFALTPLDVVTGLAALVGKSLVATEVEGPELRYRLNDLTRRYANQRMEAAGLGERCRQAHAKRMLYLTELSKTEWGRRDRVEWAESYVSRVTDLRAACLWASAHSLGSPLSQKLTAALPFWLDPLSAQCDWLTA